MQLVSALFLASVASFAIALPHLDERDQSKTGERIVGGSEVAEGELPYMVAIYFDLDGDVSFQCGGSLITQYHVITAAHCVDGWYAERFWVRWSSNHNLASPSADEQTIQASQVTLFPYFHFEIGTAIPTNDVAVLTVRKGHIYPVHADTVKRAEVSLTEPLVNGETISLPSQGSAAVPGTTCMVAGWGSLEDGGPLSDVLNRVDVDLQDNSACYETYGIQMRETMLCAGVPEGGKDACAGDSGGPLICDGTFTGIVSWGDGCAEPGKYGVYTHLALFSDWIEKNNFVVGYPSGSEM